MLSINGIPGHLLKHPSFLDASTHVQTMTLSCSLSELSDQSECRKIARAALAELEWKFSRFFTVREFLKMMSMIWI